MQEHGRRPGLGLGMHTQLHCRDLKNQAVHLPPSHVKSTFNLHFTQMYECIYVYFWTFLICMTATCYPCQCYVLGDFWDFITFATYIMALIMIIACGKTLKNFPGWPWETTQDQFRSGSMVWDSMSSVPLTKYH